MFSCGDADPACSVDDTTRSGRIPGASAGQHRAELGPCLPGAPPTGEPVGGANGTRCHPGMPDALAMIPDGGRFGRLDLAERFAASEVPLACGLRRPLQPMRPDHPHYGGPTCAGRDSAR